MSAGGMSAGPRRGGAAVVSRRALLGAGGGLFCAALPAVAAAGGASARDAADFGLVADSPEDQGPALRAALEALSSAGGGALFLPAGRFRLSEVVLPPGTVLEGVPGRTLLEPAGGETVLRAQDAPGLRLRGLRFRGRGGVGGDDWSGLVVLAGCTDLAIGDCRFEQAPGNGLLLEACAGRVAGCSLSGIHGAAIFSWNGAGLRITDNDIRDCGNLGIYLAREASGHDGAIVARNRISGIDWKDGGNGQNGNAINAFRTDSVVISDNVISGCAFSAIRLHSTRNCHVGGNLCTDCAEVAIFSEFGFSGSVIADNIIDTAAQGISITNFDSDGRLATCTGNIVRNILPESATNPDTTPVGIAAEADTVISANLVEGVPGIGLALGWGPYLRDVVASGNLLRGCDIAIGISIAEGAGGASVTGNRIRRAPGGLAISGMLWDEVAESDLAAGAGRYPALEISGNRIVG